jgi:hypothetical protein
MKTATSFRGVRGWTRAPVFLTVLAFTLEAFNSSAALLAPGDNSSVVVNPVGGNLVQDWSINGFNILNSATGGFQGLYYSVGGGVATPIQSGIGALSTVGPTVVGDTATLNTTYSTAGNPFSLQAVYTLTGGQVGSSTSDLTEDLTIKNNQATTLNIRFFQYANFTVPNATVSLQTSLYRGTPLYTLVEVAGSGISVNEYVDATLNPGAGSGSITPNLVDLTTIPGYGYAGPAVNTSGPGSKWALQWNFAIQAGQSVGLSKDIYVTIPQPAPEPGVVSLLSLGFLAFGGFKFYRRCSAR